MKSTSQMIEECICTGGKVSRDAGPVKGGKTVIAFVEDPTGYKWELITREGKIKEPIAQVSLPHSPVSNGSTNISSSTSISVSSKLSKWAFITREGKITEPIAQVRLLHSSASSQSEPSISNSTSISNSSSSSIKLQFGAHHQGRQDPSAHCSGRAASLASKQQHCHQQ